MSRFVGEVTDFLAADIGEPRATGDLYLPGDLILFGELTGEASKASIAWSVAIF